MSKALLIPKYQDCRTQHVLITGASQSRQYWLTEDPFGLDQLIKESAKKEKVVAQDLNSSEPDYPLGFTPLESLSNDKEGEEVNQIGSFNDVGDETISCNSRNNSSVRSKREHVDSLNPATKPLDGFSVLEHFHKVISIGQAMGFGFGGKEKKRWVKELCLTHRVNFLSVQETKLSRPDVVLVKNNWGNMSFDFATCSAQGRSGEILGVWDKVMFQMQHTYSIESCLCVEGTWMSTNTNLLFMSIYAPQDISRKRQIWSYVSGMINRWHGEVLVMGDFTEVQYGYERFGSIFQAAHAMIFNTFIEESQLFDIPLRGYSFTWSDTHACKMSKLDRFLKSEGVLDTFPNLSRVILHQNLSDHKSILLRETNLDYGPTPFWLFHSWFLEPDFVQVVEDTWKGYTRHDCNDMVGSKNKLKLLKQKLKDWSSSIDVANKANAFWSIVEMDQKIVIDFAQQAKIKWAIERDENSKFFHGIINKKRKQQAIRGILVDGEWVDNPERVKIELFNHFANRYADPEWVRPSIDEIFQKWLGDDHRLELEHDVAEVEIKNSIWDCGSDKYNSFPNGCNPSFISLIPKVIDAKIIDEFHPINLIGCQYRIISKILANRLSTVVDELVSYEKLAFIKGRQILDGPLILNEVISLCKARNEVKIGDNMSRINSWQEVILKVSSKLSKWKAKTLSVGGKLMLIKSVLGAIPTYFMSLYKVPEVVLKHIERLRNSFFLGAELEERKISWVSWKMVMAEKQYGGIGVSSLIALNRALLFKWIWRFLNSQSGFWQSIIKAIYVPNCSLDEPIPRCTCGSVWVAIHKSIDTLKSKEVDLMQFCNKVIGNGSSTSFWHERWNEILALKRDFIDCLIWNLKNIFSLLKN
uniref:RNA-directed DNA polymerase, eukaryota n=1 Tax=Tanacetum cinerariifolium TaxID=118510 RepID=A0A6L2N7E5_TANCI|nr:RNA-directed DNA polymerase, eukaryota [Tanacetum cinerariifolium]